MDNNVTVTADVIEGSSSNPDVTEGVTIQTNVVQGNPITANVVVGGKGDKGDVGATGAGVPNGGTTDQILKKNSNTDQDTEWHTPVKADVGLGNVDNTSDANKPVSTAQAAAIGVVQSDINAHEADIANPHAVTKAQVGLSSVPNTDFTAAVAANTAKISFDLASSTKLAGIETGADVTDTANVTAAGALMDSEVTNLADVKAFDPTDYATAAQGATADSAVQPGDLATVATTGAYSDLIGTPSIPDSVDDLSPSQAGNSGKFLKTNGTTATWEAISSGGDMLASTYDPQNIADDAFDQDNMTDGTTNKNYTATEKTKLGHISVSQAVDLDTMESDLSDHIANTSNPHSVTKSQVGLGNADNTSDATKQAATLLAAFPVGSIYINTSNTNPGTFLGGTWAAFGAGRVPVGFDSGQTEFDTDEETGGAKTHTLTTAEMPSHTHVQDPHNHLQNPHLHSLGNHGTTGTYGHLDSALASSSGVFNSNNTTATNIATTATNQNTGGGGAHNNLQPYIVVRMWKRTA